MANQFTYDVFLSHNSHDKARVRTLAERLQKVGLRVWFDEWVIKPGDDIFMAIERGLEAARVQILCLSPEALGSEWVTLERNTVLFRDPNNSQRRFVPLLLADCELPDTLRRYKYVDYRDQNRTAFDELLSACQSDIAEKHAATKSKPSNKTPETLPAKTSEPSEQKPLAVLKRKLEGHKNWVTSVAVSPDSTWFVSSSDDKTVKIWDIKTGECRATLQGHTNQVKTVSITPDAKRILSGSWDYMIRTWDVVTGKEIAYWRASKSHVLSLVPLSDNQQVIACGAGGDLKLRIWHIENQQCLREMQGHSSVVKSVALSQDNKIAVSGSYDKTVRVWDIQTGDCLAVLEGHSHHVNSVQISPDGCFAVSGSNDKTVKIWDLQSKTCVGTLEGHQVEIYSVAISPSGNLIASTGFMDKTVRLWDWRSGVCLQIIENGAYWVPISVAFSADGSQFIVGTGAPSRIYIYQLTTAQLVSPAESTLRYVNAKVVLLGEGTVGKTSLAHRLIDDEYVVKDRTHGMNVWPLPLPLAADNDLDREALLWDLAGQEDYRLIHRLFLHETALALLLVNPQKDDPFAEAGDWLKALDTAADHQQSQCAAQRLLVFSQIDVGGMKLGDAKIERFVKEQGFCAWLATSAKTGKACSDELSEGKSSRLKQLIAEHIPWDKLPWTSTPRLLAELKTTLMQMRDSSDIRLLRFAELAQRLKQGLPSSAFDEADVRTAVTLLENQGLARRLKFGDLVLLQPELLNGYAGAIIRAARAHKDEIGCLQEANIYAADFDFTGIDDRLPRADEELLLRALVQTFLDHSLCIAEETPQGRQLVFPSQYRREKDIPWEPAVFVSYTFAGEWQTIWTTLVVRLWYSHEFEQKELWRNAVEFNSNRGHLLGLKIDNRQGEGEATISLFFDVAAPDELKVIFIEYVHRHLAKYACDVVRDRRYACNDCGTPVDNLLAVRKRFEAGKDFITCQICDAKVPLLDFIEQRLKSDPVAQQILAMEEKATQQLDKQALEQILIGHMMATCGEANQIYRPVSLFDYGIDGEVEFRDNQGQPSGKKIYVQLKSGNSYLRQRKSDGNEIFDIKNDHHLDYWINQPVDVYLVIRQTDEQKNEQSIRWMNVSRYLRERKNPQNRQIAFDGEPLTMQAVWHLRDRFFRC